MTEPGDAAVNNMDRLIRKAAEKHRPTTAPKAVFKFNIHTRYDLEVHRLEQGILVLVGPMPITERRLPETLTRAWQDIERVVQ